MTVTALPGAGAMQQQYATITVVNRGVGCWLVGYARVSLRVGGRALGTPAAPAHSGTPALFIRAGRSATALLHGPSTCNSPLSDHARVAVPGGSSSFDLGLPMRGCALVIDPFRAG
jgi:uncharacterized protein DUF4232